MAAVSRDDPDAVCALFADDAEVEDPVGSGRIFSGKENLQTFYKRVTGRRIRMSPNGPICGSEANAAVAPILVKIGETTLNAISVAIFDDSGLMKEYRAYWGPGDFEGIDPRVARPVLT
jgi:steroid delta-isomerase